MSHKMLRLNKPRKYKVAWMTHRMLRKHLLLKYWINILEYIEGEKVAWMTHEMLRLNKPRKYKVAWMANRMLRLCNCLLALPASLPWPWLLALPAAADIQGCHLPRTQNGQMITYFNSTTFQQQQQQPSHLLALPAADTHIQGCHLLRTQKWTHTDDSALFASSSRHPKAQLCPHSQRMKEPLLLPAAAAAEALPSFSSPTTHTPKTLAHTHPKTLARTRAPRLARRPVFSLFSVHRSRVATFWLQTWLRFWTNV